MSWNQPPQHDATQDPQRNQPPYPYPQSPPYPYPSAPDNNGLAIASLVLGILSWVLSIMCFGFVLAIPAVILGHLSLNQVRQGYAGESSRGMAIAGLVLGYICLALYALLILIYVGMLAFGIGMMNSLTPTPPFQP